MPHRVRRRPAAVPGCRARVYAFLTVLLAGNAGVLLLPALTDRLDPYAAAHDGLADVRAAPLSVRDQVAMKLAHGSSRPSYDVGLFGNSRVVMVGPEHVPSLQGSLFNFAVGGTSFLQSARSFAYLADRGRAPALAVLSVDNFSIGYFGYRLWPDPLGEPGLMVEDALDTAASGAGTVAAARVFAAELRAGWRETVRHWSFDTARRRVAALLGERSAEPTYGSDGNTISAVQAVDPEGFLFAGSFSWTPLYDMLIRAALERLARAAERAGTAVIVYESPVIAELAATLSAEQAALADAARDRFFAACAELGLTCVRHVPEGTATPALWVDCCHMRPEPLGAYIADLIREHADQPPIRQP